MLGLPSSPRVVVSASVATAVGEDAGNGRAEVESMHQGSATLDRICIPVSDGREQDVHAWLCYDSPDAAKPYLRGRIAWSAPESAVSLATASFERWQIPV